MKAIFFKRSMLLLLLFISWCTPLLQVQSTTVSAKYGEIEGLTASLPNVSARFKSVTKFLGVPFAAPPIGELRFKAPTEPMEWKPNVRPAKKHGNICWQRKTFKFIIQFETLLKAQNFSYSEDCLYLDVYTPNVSLSLPVMVYIHGGSNEVGTAITFPGDILALQGVVVVVIQYRFGPFGFLTTGDSASPGNFGMLDQVEAMKWVKDNIENFGGNPNNVTIFGTGTGGSSVSLHLLSPLSKDLFHQAIAESGVDLAQWAIQPASIGLHYAKKLAENLDCATSSSKDMMDCIRSKEDTDIQTASESVLATFRFKGYLPWAPVVDKTFLHDTPQNLRKKNEFRKVPLMVSFNSHEGAGFLGSFFVNDSLTLMQGAENGVRPSLFELFLKRFAQDLNSGKEVASLVADALQFMYTPWPDNRDVHALKTQLVDLIGYYLFFAPCHEAADIHSKVAPVYMYEFAYSSSPGNAVENGDNMPYDFGFPLLPRLSHLYNVSTDKNGSLSIMELYVNFATYGNPTPKQVRSVTWKRFNSSHRAYLRVVANPRMAASFYPRRMAFWNDYYPKLTQVRFETKKEVVSGACVVTVETFLQFIFAIILALI